MAFEFCQSMIDEYLTRGYVIFRGIVPPSLLRDLRAQADQARGLAHELRGPQAQRIQPLYRYSDRIDFKPFQDYLELPELRDAVERLLGAGFCHGTREVLGLLVEPQDRPWNHGWHRDSVVEVPPEASDEIVRAKLAEIWYDRTHFNQVNCALYNDSSTWYVPGSHLRQWDLPGEVQTSHRYTDRLKTMVQDLSTAEAERLLLEHCRQFPGAVQTHLGPGDYMIYRNHAWHCGNYVTYQPRATLHDTVRYHVDDGWREQWAQVKQQAVARAGAAAAS
jgi:hypothetical protein